MKRYHISDTLRNTCERNKGRRRVSSREVNQMIVSLLSKIQIGVFQKSLFITIYGVFHRILKFSHIITTPIIYSMSYKHILQYQYVIVL